MQNNYTKLDQEIAVIAAVWDLIGSMVHYGHFDKGHRLENTFLTFSTREASKLFLIVLADFLSLPREGTFGLARLEGKGSLAKTHLGLLNRIAESPSFGGDTSLLRKAIADFAVWLDGDVVVDNVWLPAIERNGTIKVQRSTYLKICGTISKHGFMRLGDIVAKIKRVLTDNGTEIDDGESYLLIPEFQEWFRDHVFIASSSVVAYHLNEPHRVDRRLQSLRRWSHDKQHDEQIFPRGPRSRGAAGSGSRR